MAININIDNQLGLVYSFRLAGKKRELVFSDDCALAMDKVNLKVDKIIDNIDKLDDEDIGKKTVDEQFDLLSSWYGEIRDAIIPFFDEFFGDGAGKEIYEYVHKSTRALTVVFNKIYDYLNKVEISKKTTSAASSSLANNA